MLSHKKKTCLLVALQWLVWVCLQVTVPGAGSGDAGVGLEETGEPDDEEQQRRDLQPSLFMVPGMFGLAFFF